MDNSSKYIIRRLGRSIEISEVNSSILVYRIPYQNLLDQNKQLLQKLIKNRFIVYILFGESKQGDDVVYVGKSTNGLLNRPTSHDDKHDNWIYCYVLTQFEERTFFNDGIIQYIENEISNRINELNHYQNTTVLTTPSTANSYDMEECYKYLKIAYEMLDVIGLDLISYIGEKSDIEDPSENDDSNIETQVPDGFYHLERKLKSWHNKTVYAKMQITNGKYIVLSGSEICPNEGQGLMDTIRIKRENAQTIDNRLQEDIVFNSPSAAASFVIGGPANGWFIWKDESNSFLNEYRIKH